MHRRPMTRQRRVSQPLEAVEPAGAARAQETEVVIIDATHLKARGAASSLALQEGGANG